MTKLTKLAAQEYIDKVNANIDVITNWNPNKPNWKEYNTMKDHELLSIAEMYLSSVCARDRQYVKDLIKWGSISSKQRFRLTCVLHDIVATSTSSKPHKPITRALKPKVDSEPKLTKTQRLKQLFELELAREKLAAYKKEAAIPKLSREESIAQAIAFNRKLDNQ